MKRTYWFTIARGKDKLRYWKIYNGQQRERKFLCSPVLSFQQITNFAFPSQIWFLTEHYTETMDILAQFYEDIIHVTKSMKSMKSYEPRKWFDEEWISAVGGAHTYTHFPGALRKVASDKWKVIEMPRQSKFYVNLNCASQSGHDLLRAGQIHDGYKSDILRLVRLINSMGPEPWRKSATLYMKDLN